MKPVEFKDNLYIDYKKEVNYKSPKFKVGDPVTKTDFDDKLSSLNRKITANKTRHLLVENEFKKSEIFDSIFVVKVILKKMVHTYFFQPIHRYFKIVSANDSNILSWKSKGLPNDSIKPPIAPNKILNPSLDYFGSKIRKKI